MVRKLPCVLGLLVLVAPVCRPATAQTLDHPPGEDARRAYDGPSLTLGAALDEALANNPTLVAARLEFEAVEQRRAQEGYLAPPTVQAEIWQWPLATVNPLDTNMYMFTMRQEIPGAGKRALRAAVVDKDVERAGNGIAVRAREVLSQVKQAYARLFTGRQAVEVQRASIALLGQTTDLLMVRYGAGHGRQGEVLKSVSEISTLRRDLVVLDEHVQLATVQVNLLLNRPPGAPIGDLVATTEDVDLPAVEDLQRVALERHPELHGARIDIERAEAQLAVARRDYQPDFMVGGGYQLMPRTAGAWTAMVGVTWPTAPWSRGRLDAVQAQAVAEVAAAKARQVVIANANTGAVQQAYIRARSARTQAALLERSVIPQLRQMFEAALVAYQSETGDAAALVENQRMVRDAQLDYVRALADLQQARADLEAVVGIDLESAR